MKFKTKNYGTIEYEEGEEIMLEKGVTKNPFAIYATPEWTRNKNDILELAGVLNNVDALRDKFIEILHYLDQNEPELFKQNLGYLFDSYRKNFRIAKLCELLHLDPHTHTTKKQFTNEMFIDKLLLTKIEFTTNENFVFIYSFDKPKLSTHEIYNPICFGNNDFEIFVRS